MSPPLGYHSLTRLTALLLFRTLRRELCFGDPAGFLCVYVGRISEEKRIDVLIEALHRLSGQRQAYLAIVGDGPLAARYAAMHGAEQRIYCRPRFLPHTELAAVYASADVHVSASEFETLGNTVLEAFACGLPVVVPRTQGFVNTVAHDTNGFLFQAKDSADAAKYLQQLKDDATLCSTMGKRGLQEVQSLTCGRVVQDLLQWYARGRQRRQETLPLMLMLRVVVMLCTVTMACVMHAIYDPMVNSGGLRRRKQQ